VLFIVLLSSMAAYAVTRLKFRINMAVLYLFVAGLLVPRSLVLGSLFLFLQDLKIVDSYFGLIPVYIAYSFPFTVFVLTPFTKSVPMEMEEAAYLDGANSFEVYWRVILPLVRSGMAIVTIFNILGIWNEYILAYTVIATEKLRTLPVGLAELARAQQYETDWTALFAALVIVIVPIFLAYSFFQKWLERGIMGGALKY
jgi:N-acetylglucosamine transport system permease protein